MAAVNSRSSDDAQASAGADPSRRKRVLVVVNKWWECDPVLNVLLHDNARPAASLGWPDPLRHPRRRPDQSHLPAEDPAPEPRATFRLPRTDVDVWCISDLLEHLPDQTKFQSSSQQKMRRMPLIFRGPTPDLVIAVGTAGTPTSESRNGSVVVGSAVFVHNAHPNGQNPDSDWQAGPFDVLTPSALTAPTFDAITRVQSASKPEATKRFLVPPLNAAREPTIFADREYVAVGSVNVTDYREYAVTDAAATDACRKVVDPALMGSLETTHALIRVSSDAPFVFVSGVTDRVGFFDAEVDPRSYAQNTVAAHNAGVVVAWMLPRIDAAL